MATRQVVLTPEDQRMLIAMINKSIEVCLILQHDRGALHDTGYEPLEMVAAVDVLNDLKGRIDGSIPAKPWT